MAETHSKIEVACPVCLSAAYTVKYEPWKNVTDPKALYGAASGVPGTQRLVTCDGCGLIYENPRYPESVIIEGYMSAVDAGHDSQFPMRVESFYRALAGATKFLPPKGAKVLDIGTAGGAFLIAAERYGYEAHGLEPSQFLTEQGQRRGLKIRQGTLDNAPFEKGSFDMVCFWDVLEHVVDVRAALQRAKELLKPGGVLLVNYPDIGTWPARLAGKRFWWILSVHIQHFDPKTMRRAAEDAGFQTLGFKRYWQTLELGYLMKIADLYLPGLGRLALALTPGFIKSAKVSYSASQTTYLGRKP